MFNIEYKIRHIHNLIRIELISGIIIIVKAIIISQLFYYTLIEFFLIWIYGYILWCIFDILFSLKIYKTEKGEVNE